MSQCAVFLDREFKFTQGFDLLILLVCLSIFLTFLKILYEDSIILSQRGIRANPL